MAKGGSSGGSKGGSSSSKGSSSSSKSSSASSKASSVASKASSIGKSFGTSFGGVSSVKPMSVAPTKTTTVAKSSSAPSKTSIGGNIGTSFGTSFNANTVKAPSTAASAAKNGASALSGKTISAAAVSSAMKKGVSSADLANYLKSNGISIVGANGKVTDLSGGSVKTPTTKVINTSNIGKSFGTSFGGLDSMKKPVGANASAAAKNSALYGKNITKDKYDKLISTMSKDKVDTIINKYNMNVEGKMPELSDADKTKYADEYKKTREELNLYNQELDDYDRSVEDAYQSGELGADEYKKYKEDAKAKKEEAAQSLADVENNEFFVNFGTDKDTLFKGLQDQLAGGNVKYLTDTFGKLEKMGYKLDDKLSKIKSQVPGMKGQGTTAEKAVEQKKVGVGDIAGGLTSKTGTRFVKTKEGKLVPVSGDKLTQEAEAAVSTQDLSGQDKGAQAATDTAVNTNKVEQKPGMTNTDGALNQSQGEAQQAATSGKTPQPLDMKKGNPLYNTAKKSNPYIYNNIQNRFMQQMKKAQSL